MRVIILFAVWNGVSETSAGSGVQRPVPVVGQRGTGTAVSPPPPHHLLPSEPGVGHSVRENPLSEYEDTSLTRMSFLSPKSSSCN